MSIWTNLIKALESGTYVGNDKAGPLIVEDLDTSNIGLYKTPPSEPYREIAILGTKYYLKLSEEGVKWNPYVDRPIAWRKELLRKND